DLTTDDGSRKEVVHARPVAQHVKLDTSVGVARELERQPFVFERLETDLIVNIGDGVRLHGCTSKESGPAARLRAAQGKQHDQPSDEVILGIVWPHVELHFL